MARFARVGLAPATRLAKRLSTPEARALLGGLCAHAMLPLERAAHLGASASSSPPAPTTAAGRSSSGGSGRLVDALVAELADAGVTSSAGAGRARARTCRRRARRSSTPRPPRCSRSRGDRLSPAYRRAVARFRYGPGVFKVDWALSGPVPWAAEGCAARDDRARRRDVRGGRRRRGRRGRGAPPRPALLIVGPGGVGRPVARAGRRRDPLGLLPRALRARTAT